MMSTVIFILFVVFLLVWAACEVSAELEYRRFAKKPNAIRSRKRTAWKWVVSFFYLLDRALYRVGGARTPMIQAQMARRGKRLQDRLNAEHGTKIVYPLKKRA